MYKEKKRKVIRVSLSGQLKGLLKPFHCALCKPSSIQHVPLTLLLTIRIYTKLTLAFPETWLTPQENSFTRSTLQRRRFFLLNSTCLHCAYTGRRALPSLCTPVLHPHHYSQGGEKNLSSFGDDANLIYCLHLSPLLSLPKYTHAGFTEGVVPWILLSPGVFNVYCKVFSNQNHSSSFGGHCWFPPHLDELQSTSCGRWIHHPGWPKRIKATPSSLSQVKAITQTEPSRAYLFP